MLEEYTSKDENPLDAIDQKIDRFQPDSSKCSDGKRAGDPLQSTNIKLDIKAAKLRAKKLISKAEKRPIPPSMEEAIDAPSEEKLLRLIFFKKLACTILSWALDLLETNMKAHYEGDGKEGAWGWNPKKKRKELTDQKAKFIVAHLESATQAAASSPGEQMRSHPVLFIHLLAWSKPCLE